MTDAAKDYKCSPCGEYKFFLYDPNDGITFWRTAEERDKAAEDAIDSYLDEEWNEEVSGVFAGMATHNTVEINRVDRVGKLDDDGYDEVGEYWANSDWDVKCSYKLQLIPQPDADHAPGVTKMVGDGEREELASALEVTGSYEIPSYEQLRRAAALLREAVAVDQKTKELITAVQATYSAYGWVPEKHFIRLFDDVARLASALEEGCDCSIQKPLNWETEILELKARPRPVPVAERPWERPGWCDADGRCWIGTPETEYPLGDTGDYDLIDASWSLELPPSDPALQRMQRVVSHPHWAIPQPPQGGEVVQ